MVKARKYIITKYFEGDPKSGDFEIVEEELDPLKEGQVLAKTEYISVDPYQRNSNNHKKLPYDQFGYQIAMVVESKNPEYPIGTRVVSHEGWRDYVVMRPTAKPDDAAAGFDTAYKLPDMRSLPVSLGVGAVGMPGVSAYFGLLELCKPRPGETLVVTSAAGAVGSIVGQIGKLLGLRVIGFAGTDDKVRWITEELGFDYGFNYRTVDAYNALREAAPDGVDCYFDNVGGELSSTIMALMNRYGRVAVCGSITSYNSATYKPSDLPKVTQVQQFILFKELKIEGFVVTRWIDRWDEGFKQLIEWIESGKIVVQEHVTEGFENLCDAFVGMLRGENKGKAVVKV